MIKFSEVTKKFGSIIALDKISFEIEDGEFVFLSGPTASGKTTILKIIISEIRQFSGKVQVFNNDILKIKDSQIPEFRRKIGSVFQDFKIIYDRTVSENVEVALAINNIPSREWNDRVLHVLKLVKLKKQINMFPNQLSGGELQRLALARALAVNPSLILADEPTGNLDYKTSVEIMDLLELLNKEGKTVVVVSHNQELVKKYKKRVINIENGRIIK